MTTAGSMTKAELVEEVSRVSDLTKKHSEVIVDTVFKSIIDALHRGEKLELRAGETYQMKIIRLVPEERKIGLSIRALKDEEFRADWEAYAESTGRPEVTLGDHFKNIK
jgi:ribosomal protein S1